MKSVLFINASLSSGGSEKVMCQIANGFVKNNIKTTMILLRNKEKTYELDDRIKLIQFNYKYKNKFLMIFERLIKLRKEIKRIDPEAVISFMTDINIFTLISSLGLAKKIIISERAHPLLNSTGEKKKPLIIRLMVKLLYPMSHKIVFQTEFAKQCFNERIKQKGVIIPNPINIKENVHTGIPCKKIVTAGRLTEQKNFEMLLRIFSRISQTYNDYKLIIYGKGKLEKQLRDLAKELNIYEKVEFAGFVNNLPEAIKDSYVFTSTSNFEGISNVMLEALAMGIPAVCTNCPVGGAELVIENGKNGYLIPVKDDILFEKALRELLKSNEKRSSFSREAIKVRDKYNLKIICKEWIKII